MQSAITAPMPSPAETELQSPHTAKRTAARALYAFDDCPPDQMIRICRLLHDRGFSGDSAVYLMPYSQRFYLSVEESPHRNGAVLPPTLLLEEFGTRIASASMLCCLDEHARCICAHDAVAVLAALAIRPMRQPPAQ